MDTDTAMKESYSEGHMYTHVENKKWVAQEPTELN